MSANIYIGNTQKTFKRGMDGHFYDLLCPFRIKLKSNSVVAHSKQHFNSTTSCIDLRKYITFKVIKPPNLIGAKDIFTKPK